MIKLELPADNKEALRVFGKALLELAGETSIHHYDDATAFDHAITEGVQDPKLGAAPVDGSTGDNSVTEATQTQTGTPSSTETKEPATGAPTVDLFGVPFNVDYCAKAADPFYKSGPDKGKWKAKRGVDKAAYDLWHGVEVGKLSEALGGETEPESTSGAFQPSVQEEKVPHTTPDFFRWMSELQAAGAITPQDVQDAYDAVGITQADMFVADQMVVQQNCIALHHYISAKANA